MSQSLYLYGFVPEDAPSPPDAVIGVDGQPVRLEPLGPFAAAVSELATPRYGAAEVEARLKDLPWVARHGAAHETVVTWFADHATIVPARLFTMFSSRAALEQEAREAEARIESQLARFRELREWDLKVHYDADVLAEHLSAHSAEIARADAEIEAAAEGRRYLLERRRERAVKQEVSAVARRLAHELFEELAALAEESRELPLPKRRDDLPVVLNAAMLLTTSQADELQVRATERAKSLAPHGVHARLTGPWAPYRFIDGAEA